MRAEKGKKGCGSRGKLRTGSGQRGFTILETTIALLVLMIACLGAASLFIISTQNNTSSGERAMAVALAQRRMEWLRNLEWDDPDSANDFVGIPTGAWQSQAVNIDNRQFSVQTRIDVTAGAGLRTITVRVTGGRGQAWARGAVTFTSQRGAR